MSSSMTEENTLIYRRVFSVTLCKNSSSKSLYCEEQKINKSHALNPELKNAQMPVA